MSINFFTAVSVQLLAWLMFTLALLGAVFSNFRFVMISFSNFRSVMINFLLHINIA